MKVTKEADSAQHKEKIFSRQSYPTMESAAQDKMSSPLLEVIKHSALNEQQWFLNPLCMRITQATH